MRRRPLAEFRHLAVGVSLQRHHCCRIFTAAENVKRAVLVRGEHTSFARSLGTSGLAKLACIPAGHRAGELSGGGHHRVAFARRSSQAARSLGG